MDTKCLNCGSSDLKSFLMIYQGGSTIGESSTFGIGTGFGVGVASTKQSGQTLLARRVTPPMKPKVEVYIFLAVISFFVAFIVMVAKLQLSPQLALIFAGLITGLEAYLFTQLHQRRKSAWIADLQQWNSSWMCQRCGDTQIHNN